MKDDQIIDLYFARNENAIRETENKYGGFCRSIAFQILESMQDVEECVNDTWLRAWNAIPPERPPQLRMWLGKVTRHISLDRFRYERAAKRNRALVLSLDELEDCIPLPDDSAADLPRLLNAFLGSLEESERNIFVGRYWYNYTLSQLSVGHGMTVSAVRCSLERTRASLKAYLEKEDYHV